MALLTFYTRYRSFFVVGAVCVCVNACMCTHCRLFYRISSLYTLDMSNIFIFLVLTTKMFLDFVKYPVGGKTPPVENHCSKQMVGIYFSPLSKKGESLLFQVINLVSVSFSLQAVTIIFLDIEVYSLLLHPGWPLWIFVLTHSSNVHLDFEMSIAFFILLFLSLYALLFIV